MHPPESLLGLVKYELRGHLHAFQNWQKGCASVTLGRVFTTHNFTEQMAIFWKLVRKADPSLSRWDVFLRLSVTLATAHLSEAQGPPILQFC